jgi:hypothetical protein
MASILGLGVCRGTQNAPPPREDVNLVLPKQTRDPGNQEHHHIKNCGDYSWTRGWQDSPFLSKTPTSKWKLCGNAPSAAYMDSTIISTACSAVAYDSWSLSRQSWNVVRTHRFIAKFHVRDSGCDDSNVRSNSRPMDVLPIRPTKKRPSRL